MSTIQSDVQVQVPLPRSAPRPVMPPRTRTAWQLFYVAGVAALDFCAAVVGLTALHVWRMTHGHSAFAPNQFDLAATMLPFAWLVTVALLRGYEPGMLGAGSDEFRRITHAGIALAAVAGFLDYAAGLSFGRRFVLGAVPVTCVASMVGRYAARKRLHRLRTLGRCRQRVVVVGHLSQVADLIATLEKERYQGMDVVGVCLPAGQLSEGREALHVPVIAPLDDLPRTVTTVAADTVAVTASTDLAGAALRRIAWQLETTGAELVVAPGLVEVVGPRLHIRPVTGLPLLQVEQPRLSGGRRLLKGLFDRCLALALLVMLLPLLVVIALAIRFTSAGPVIFRQARVGLNETTFTLFKFRTMVADAERMLPDLVDLNVHGDEVLFKIPNDPRITRVGRWLRRYSLDELPQLANVLLGKMSLVGPRPPLPDEVARYADHARRRLLVKPGLTGLWQVSGRSDLDWEESVRLDLRYVENWSLALDLMSMWKTAFAMFRGEGAY